MTRTLVELTDRLGGTLHHADGGRVAKGFVLDNREVQPGNIFLAIEGENVDGHDFCADALARGAAVCVTEKPVAGPHILTTSLVSALANFGLSLRKEFNGPVVGITGSNGKTSAKEFTAAALSALGPVLKNQGNRNTEYTSPLVWDDLILGSGLAHRSAVIEMGMRGFGQIKHLAEIAQPTIALITMIGTAHIEMVGSREGIATAKAELLDVLPDDGTAILLQEDEYFGTLQSHARGRTRTFGFSPDAECRVIGYRATSWSESVILGTLDGAPWEVRISTIGRHQAQNVAAAILVAQTAGVSVAAAADGAASAVLPPMRMDVREIRGFTVVLDNYNASPDSSVAAIKTLMEQPATGRRVVIFGEMKELGDFSESGHRLVGRALAQSQPDEVVFYGEQTVWTRDEAVGIGFDPSRIRLAMNLEEISSYISALKPGDVVLIKGSRALGLERALDSLVEVG